MPRRRRSAVPGAEWRNAFAIWNMATAAAYDELNVPPVRGLGAYLRQAINKFYIPKLKMALAANPGIETPEEIGNIIKELIQREQPDEEFFRNYMRSQIPDERVADLYAAAIARLWNEMRQRLPDKVDEAVRKLQESLQESLAILERLAGR